MRHMRSWLVSTIWVAIAARIASGDACESAKLLQTSRIADVTRKIADNTESDHKVRVARTLQSPTEVNSEDINACKNRRGHSMVWYANNGACNDGTRPCEGHYSCTHFGSSACMVGTDCNDCGNCPSARESDHHAQGEVGSNSCPPKTSRILSSELCESAASAVGVRYSGSTDNGEKPKGCYIHDDGKSQYAFYNAHSEGSQYTHGAPLCSKHCDAEAHCSGHGTTSDTRSEDGCDCTCTDNYSGENCGTELGARTPPAPPPGSLPTFVECGNTYPFQLRRGQVWRPKVRAAIGAEVFLSTCSGGGDTVIDDPCYNDDACQLSSKCSYTCAKEEQEAAIMFFSRGAGKSSLTVTCENK